jgi:starch synthase (maltosyl-transferring)
LTTRVESLATPHLYNLFPRLAGDAGSWAAHAARARAMGFDWLYLNPIHFPGFSGSCYAVKEYRRIDPLLLPAGHPDQNWDEPARGDGGVAFVRDALAAVRKTGMLPVMDLVLNHTARDAALVDEHPDWYVRDPDGVVQSPSAIDPADARQVTVWGDLAEIDNAASADRDALWNFWEQLVEWGIDLGFVGFRCDAAYKVPAALWQRLIATARAREPRALFFGETLGARLEEIEALKDSGLHFVFNSSKWWAFDAPWCLEQQAAQPPGVRSVSFPESHDTPRLWQESGGDPKIQRQRYAFAAAFASGVMMPLGFEYGFERRIDVVTTRASDWETPSIDLTTFVARVHAARRRHPALASESNLVLGTLDRPVLLLEKRSDDAVAWVAINKDREMGQPIDLPEAARGRRVLRVCRDGAVPEETAAAVLDLDPAEVAYIV